MTTLRLGFIFVAHVALLVMAGCDAPKPTDSKASASAASTSTASASASASASAAAATTPSATATASTAPKVELPNHLDGAVVEAVAGIAPAPSDWSDVPEVTVTGSSGAGCETKVAGSWFHALCVSESRGFGNLKSATIVAGLRPGQTKLIRLVMAKDQYGRDIPGYEIITPYVKGTSFTFNLRWVEGSNLDVVITWPADKAAAPKRVGIVQQAPQRDAIP